MNEFYEFSKSLIKNKFDYSKARSACAGHDWFPKLQRATPSDLRRTPNHSIYDDVKSAVWKSVARSCDGLGYCYGKPMHDSVPKELVELVNVGHSQIADFLDLDAYQRLIETLNKYPSSNTVHESKWTTLPNAISSLFDSKISHVTSAFFKKNVRSRALLHRQHSRDGLLSSVENSDPHVFDWHCDRYIPCMKAIYFPFGCDWLPFEIIEMSSPAFFQTVSRRKIKTFYKDLPAELSQAKIYQSYVEPNTLLLTFNHLFHRRSQITSPGERKTIFLDWWNGFNYKDLIVQGVFKQ